MKFIFLIFFFIFTIPHLSAIRPVIGVSALIDCFIGIINKLSKTLISPDTESSIIRRINRWLTLRCYNNILHYKLGKDREREKEWKRVSERERERERERDYAYSFSSPSLSVFPDVTNFIYVLILLIYICPFPITRSTYINIFGFII